VGRMRAGSGVLSPTCAPKGAFILWVEVWLGLSPPLCETKIRGRIWRADPWRYPARLRSPYVRRLTGSGQRNRSAT